MREFLELPPVTPLAVRLPQGGFRRTKSPIPPLAEGDILFRLLGAGISQTDTGPHGPDRVVLVGETAALGSRSRGWGPGDRIVVRVPIEPERDARWPDLAGFFRLPATVVRSRLAFKLPRETTLDEALLLPEAARAVQALRECRLGEGETIVVAGLGLLGQLTVALAHHRRRARVVAADPSPTLRWRADYNGAEVLVRIPEDDLFEAVVGRPRRQGAAAAVAEAVPSAILQALLASLAPGGTLLVASPAEAVWPLDARLVFHRELRVAGLNRVDARDFKDAAKAFQQGLADPDTLVSKRIAWDDLATQDFGRDVWQHSLQISVNPPA